MGDALRKRWYEWIAGKPCVGCRAWPVQVAHLKLLISNKTGDPLPRRKGANIWAAIPLCLECHLEGPRSIHKLGEAAWMKERDLSHETLLLLWGSWLAAFLAGENP